MFSVAGLFVTLGGIQLDRKREAEVKTKVETEANVEVSTATLIPAR